MEAFGLLSAIVGLVAAYINRRRIIEVRYVSQSHPQVAPRTPVTIGKRLKRLAIALIVGFLFAALGGQSDASAEVFVWPFAICFLVASYQALAVAVLLLASLWR
jgi:hypothetical protein